MSRFWKIRPWSTWQTNDLIQTAMRQHYCGTHPQGHFQEPHEWSQNYKVLQYVWSLSTLWYHRQRFGWIRNNQTISIFVATELLQVRQLCQSLVDSFVWHLGPRSLCLMISFSSLIASFKWSYCDTATWDIVRSTRSQYFTAIFLPCCYNLTTWVRRKQTSHCPNCYASFTKGISLPSHTRYGWRYHIRVWDYILTSACSHLMQHCSIAWVDSGHWVLYKLGGQPRTS